MTEPKTTGICLRCQRPFAGTEPDVLCTRCREFVNACSHEDRRRNEMGLETCAVCSSILFSPSPEVMDFVRANLDTPAEQLAEKWFEHLRAKGAN